MLNATYCSVRASLQLARLAPYSSTSIDPCLFWPRRRPRRCSYTVPQVRSTGTASSLCLTSHPFGYGAGGSRYHSSDGDACAIILSVYFSPPMSANHTHLYVTPRDESIRTFCLFLLMVLLAPSSLDPLVLDRDLYTEAMVSTKVVRQASGIGLMAAVGGSRFRFTLNFL